jgi:rod shape-determining protein MreD
MTTSDTPPTGWLPLATLIAALFLSILPLPFWAEPYRPEWLAVTLIFWCLSQPQRIGVFWGFSAGLVLDVTQGALLGQHALTLSLVAFLAVELNRRIMAFPAWQQAVSIWLILLLERLINLWIMGTIGYPTPSLVYWLPTLTSALLWPWVAALLRALCLRTVQE